jgi:hypothetical protein
MWGDDWALDAGVRLKLRVRARARAGVRVRAEKVVRMGPHRVDAADEQPRLGEQVRDDQGAARLVALERALLERRQHGVDAVACNGLEEGLAGGRREQVVHTPGGGGGGASRAEEAHARARGGRGRARLGGACMMRAEPNMDPRAVERQAVATPRTTKRYETHVCCTAARSYCSAARSMVAACPTMSRR